MISRLISDLAGKGRYCFSAKDAAAFSKSSDVAVRAALRRLRQKGEIAMPYRGFYVILPPEYRDQGCLPAGHFIPSLMEHLGEKYYAGLLSAAEYHGAAHHRPQVFQVVVSRNRPPISCGKVRVEFIARKNAGAIPTSDFKTPRGYLKVSTPAATAFDLVGYPHHSGGLDNVATVLAELAEKIDGKELARIAGLSPIAWAQRLGYILDLVGAGEKAVDLAKYIARKKPVPIPLMPSKPFVGINQTKPWRIMVNTEVEAEV